MKHLVAALGLAFLLGSAGSANAETRAQFCSRWNVVCKKTCPPGQNCDPVCAERVAACRTNGCYFFNRPRTRCETEPVPTCTEQKQRCVTNTGNEQACEAARTACMRTGRWIGWIGSVNNKIDFGPAQKR